MSARRIAWASLLTGFWLSAALAASVADASDGDERAEEARDRDAAEEADDVMGGFEDDGFPSGETEPSEPGAESEFDSTAGTASEPMLKGSWWDLTGYASVTEAFSYLDHHSSSGRQYRGLAGLRARGGLQLDLDLPHEWQARVAGSAFYDFAYRINGRGEYTNQVLNSYEWDADVGELWLGGPLLPALDLKVGRQVVNWGRSDSLRVLDVLNPVDNREPGLLDLVDLRLPVGMAKLSYYPHPNWTLTGIAIPEIRFSLDPVFGSDFYPAPIPQPPETTSSGFSAKHAQWAASVSGIFEGWDLSFHFADAYEDTPHLAPSATLPGGSQMEHDRVLLGGVGGDYAIGSWLVKAELAVIDGVKFALWDGATLTTTDEKTRIDAMLGLEYYGFVENTLALEIVNRHIDDFEGSMRGFPSFARRDVVETALRWSADWWHARLHTTALAIVIGEKAQDGAVLRFSGDYDIRDGLTAGAGIQIFLKGSDSDGVLGTGSDSNGLLNPFSQNDRIFLRVKYNF